MSRISTEKPIRDQSFGSGYNKAYGFQFLSVSLDLPADHFGRNISSSEKRQQPVSARCQPAFLRLGRTEVYRTFAAFHNGKLFLRNAD